VASSAESRIPEFLKLRRSAEPPLRGKICFAAQVAFQLSQ
jgi:hypothetical protein